MDAVASALPRNTLISRSESSIVELLVSIIIAKPPLRLGLSVKVEGDCANSPLNEEVFVPGLSARALQVAG